MGGGGFGEKNEIGQFILCFLIFFYRKIHLFSLIQRIKPLKNPSTYKIWEKRLTHMLIIVLQGSWVQQKRRRGIV